METAISYKHGGMNLQANERTQTQERSAFWEMIEFNRFGVNMIVLFTAMISGGIAGAFALNMGDLQFGLMIALSMLTLTMVLGLVNMKIVVTMGIITFLVSMTIIFIGIANYGGMMNPH